MQPITPTEFVVDSIFLSGQDNTGIYDADYQDPSLPCKNVTVEKM